MHILHILGTQGRKAFAGLHQTQTNESSIELCSIFLVFEYCTHDLGRLVDAMPRPFSPSEVKCLMLQVRLAFFEQLLQGDSARLQRQGFARGAS